MGAFVTYKDVTGLRLDDCSEIRPIAAARIALGLMSAVIVLHRAGLQHGNLDGKCIFVSVHGDEVALTVSELFNSGEFGDGQVRPVTWRPTNWEKLSDEHLDRFAAISVARKMLDSVADERLEICRQKLAEELERPAIETLDPVRDMLVEVVADLQKPPVPSISIGLVGSIGITFPSDAGFYYARASRLGLDIIRYLVFGLGCQMNVLLAADREPEVEVTSIGFELMRREAERCEQIRAIIGIKQSQSSEIQELVDLLAGLRIEEASQEISGDDAAEAPPIAETIPDATETLAQLETGRFWSRSIELEQNLVPEVTIASDIVSTGTSWIAKYDTFRGNFDFDPEDAVDIHVSIRKRRIGRMDITETDGSQLVIKELDWNLRKGDVVQLVERQQRTSYDRRKRAVDRIIARGAPIKELLEYFDIGGSAEAIEYGAPVESTSIAKYGLNAGQQKAFIDVARRGPVGLLQGPPGTGKTRFIAALVHWLATDQKVERILIASQSHEAVNNVIETVLKTFRSFGHRANLLRIGSKNITPAVRPYHTASVRERYGVSFTNSIRSRLSSLASSIGIDRRFAQAAVDLDRRAGSLARRYHFLLEEIDRGGHQSDDERRLNATLRTVRNAFEAVMKSVGSEHFPAEEPSDGLNRAFGTLRKEHGIPESDELNMRLLLALAQEWTEALSSSSRNREDEDHRNGHMRWLGANAG
jgi:hypothetical protein